MSNNKECRKRREYNKKRRWMFQLTEKERDLGYAAIKFYKEKMSDDFLSRSDINAVNALERKFKLSYGEIPLDTRKFNRMFKNTLKRQMEIRYARHLEKTRLRDEEARTRETETIDHGEDRESECLLNGESVREGSCGG